MPAARPARAAAWARDRSRLAVGGDHGGRGLFLLLRLTVWPPHEDETLVFFVSRRPLGDVLDTVLGDRGGAPLHFLLAHVALLVDESLTALRALSALFATASIPVIAALAARLAGRGTAVLAALLAAASWMLLFHGVYARMYGLFLFTSALSCLLLLRALERQTGGRWAAWAAATLAMVATQPYGALVLAAQAVFVGRLRIRRPISLRPGLLAFAAVVLLAAPALANVRPPCLPLRRRGGRAGRLRAWVAGRGPGLLLARARGHHGRLGGSGGSGEPRGARRPRGPRAPKPRSGPVRRRRRARPRGRPPPLLEPAQSFPGDSAT